MYGMETRRSRLLAWRELPSAGSGRNRELWFWVLGEECPDEVGTGDAVAAHRVAGPGVSPTLDGTERHARAIFAARIDVDEEVARFLALRSRRTAVVFHPEGHGVGDGIVGAPGAELIPCRAAIERDQAIRGAMKNDDGNGAGWTAIKVLRAFHGSYRSDFVGQIAGGAIAHHSAVRDSSHEDALGIDGVILFEFSDQRAQEAGIVHVVEHGIAATIAGVPRGHAADAACAAGIDGDEILLICLGAHAGHALGAFRALAAAVKHENERKLRLTVVAGRNVNQIGAGASPTSSEAERFAAVVDAASMRRVETTCKVALQPSKAPALNTRILL